MTHRTAPLLIALAGAILFCGGMAFWLARGLMSSASSSGQSPSLMEILDDVRRGSTTTIALETILWVCGTTSKIDGVSMASRVLRRNGCMGKHGPSTRGLRAQRFRRAFPRIP